MIKSVISLIIIFFILGCENTSKKNITNIVDNTKKIINKKSTDTTQSLDSNTPNNNVFYYLGENYFIEGVEYIPEENYSYNETGLASFYGKELHNTKTINNDLNKVTELLGRHKTLPLPSVVKITNLENGLSVVIKIVDRHQDNSSLIQVSRKVAQLLKFYKNKVARVRVEILKDPSKQWKSVSLSMNETAFNDTIKSAPTDIVSISDLDENLEKSADNTKAEQPIEIGSETVINTDLFIKVSDFENYNEIKEIIIELDKSLKHTIERNNSLYNLILGPIKNEEADKLVSYFVSKGYKKTEIILK